MKISYRIPIYQYGGQSGIRYLRNDPDEWRRLVFSPYRQHILDLLKKYGEANDYGYWLNEMLGRHANLYKAAEASGDWQSVAYRSNDVGKYQLDYRGGIDNNGTYQRYGSIKINPEDRYNFNETGIRNAQNNNRYDFFGPSRRLESDRGDSKYLIDNLYSGITDDRRILGRRNDWNEDSDEYKLWQKDLNATGWEMYLDSDDYYKLRRLPVASNPQETPAQETPQDNGTGVIARHSEGGYGFDWGKLRDVGQKIFSDPDLYGIGRLAGNLINNERVYGELLKGIRPVLRQTYNTYRQVVGDEATKQAYYRRAAQGQTKAARPFTSDADRQMAYLFEAKRVGDELRALGDLADNQEIRRTSDESNQHQWANTLRATEVANTNIASINLANALRHNLLAQKHAAQWSSIDNFLKEIETRKRLRIADEQALLDEIDLLEASGSSYDPEYISAYKKFNDVLEKHKKADNTYDETNPDVMRARGEWEDFRKRRTIESRRRLLERRRNRNGFSIFSAKSGTKITHKKKDDLLYKSTRDVVEHFRKMSKMSSDALNRRTPKIEKLTSHPKGKTKKYLQGGLAPFTVYTPVVLGGETSRTTSTSSSERSSSSGKGDKNESFDMIKDLFKMLLGKGLPSDVTRIYNNINAFMLKSKLFGNELSVEDMASMFLSQMQEINRVEGLLKDYDIAYDSMVKNDAVNEVAVDSYGRIVAQDKDGQLTFVSSLDEAREKLVVPLTNDLVAKIRKYSPEYAGMYNLDLIMANGIGISKITEFIKSILPNLGTEELIKQGYTKHEANQIREGFELLTEAPAGDYEFTSKTKDLKNQIQHALNYITGALKSKGNMYSVLKFHADLLGTTPEDMVMSLLLALRDTLSSLEFDPLTGKAAAAKKGDGNNNEGDSEGLKLDAATALITGKGYSTNIELNTGSSYAVNVKARYSEFLKHSGENMGAGITMQEASTSTLKGVLDWNKATLGGSTLNPTAYNYIVLNNGEVVGIDLPTKPENKNIPDFEMLKKLELLDDQLLVEGIEDSPLNWLKVNEICSKLLLPPKYDNLGKLNRLSWNRFAAFLVTTTEKALNDKKVILDMLGIADEQSREFYEGIIQDKTKNDKYSLDSGWPIFGGKEELYQGTVFVPIKNNLVAGAISSGLKISMTDATDLELRQRGYDLLKISTYKKNELVL